MGGPEVEHLIDLLAKLPGLGPRSARRTALRLLQEAESRMLPLARALVEAARAVRPCGICGNLDSCDPCAICADPERDQGLICVVETVGDLWALERSGVHPGVYHVLGGTLSALAGIGRGSDGWGIAAARGGRRRAGGDFGVECHGGRGDDGAFRGGSAAGFRGDSDASGAGRADWRCAGRAR